MSPEPKGLGSKSCGYSQNQQAPASTFLYVGGQGESWVPWPWPSSPGTPSLKQGVSCASMKQGPSTTLNLALQHSLLRIAASSNTVSAWLHGFPSLPALLRLWLLYPAEHRLWLPFSHLPKSLNLRETSSKALKLKGVVREPILTHSWLAEW